MFSLSLWILGTNNRFIEVRFVVQIFHTGTTESLHPFWSDWNRCALMGRWRRKWHKFRPSHLRISLRRKRRICIMQFDRTTQSQHLRNSRWRRRCKIPHSQCRRSVSKGKTLPESWKSSYFFHVSNLIRFLQLAHVGFGGGGKGYSVTGLSSGGDYLLWERLRHGYKSNSFSD